MFTNIPKGDAISMKARFACLGKKECLKSQFLFLQKIMGTGTSIMLVMASTYAKILYNKNGGCYIVGMMNTAWRYKTIAAKPYQSMGRS